jgi:chemotaxis protein MotA
MDNIERRHASGQEIFFYMGAYAPAFGMLGTIMGLIIMMHTFGGEQTAMGMDAMTFDISEKFAKLLEGMGMALITTFYGVLLSNLVFLPIGGKLKRKSEDELMLRNIIVEGIMSIHAKEHPILIKEKLMTFVQESKRPDKE